MNPGSQFGLKDSGSRESFASGMLRDTQDGKPRVDLVSPFFLWRLGHVCARGASKYGDRNWELGAPLSRYLASAERHLQQWKMGLTDEDHLVQAAWNLMAIAHHQEVNPHLNDMPDYYKQKERSHAELHAPAEREQEGPEAPGLPGLLQGA